MPSLFGGPPQFPPNPFGSPEDNEENLKKIKKAHLLQELRERLKYCQRPWTNDEFLTLIITIREAWLPEDIGIIRRRRI